MRLNSADLPTLGLPTIATCTGTALTQQQYLLSQHSTYITWVLHLGSMYLLRTFNMLHAHKAKKLFCNRFIGREFGLGSEEGRRALRPVETGKDAFPQAIVQLWQAGSTCAQSQLPATLPPFVLNLSPEVCACNPAKNTTALARKHQGKEHAPWGGR